MLNALYPVAILLICLSFVPELEQRHPLVYPLCIGCTALQSVASASSELEVGRRTFAKTCNRIKKKRSLVQFALLASLNPSCLCRVHSFRTQIRTVPSDAFLLLVKENHSC